MKRVTMLCLLIAFATVAAAKMAWSDTESNAPSEPSQKIVVHLSHFTDDLHRCFMALKLATLMQKSGADVTLFLDLEGVRLAERRQLLDMTWGSDATPLTEHYQRFIEADGRVVLCPHCAKSARIGDPALQRNAEIGTEHGVGKMLLAAEKILDY